MSPAETGYGSVFHQRGELAFETVQIIRILLRHIDGFVGILLQIIKHQRAALAADPTLIRAGRREDQLEAFIAHDAHPIPFAGVARFGKRIRRGLLAAEKARQEGAPLHPTALLELDARHFEQGRSEMDELHRILIDTGFDHTRRMEDERDP